MELLVRRRGQVVPRRDLVGRMWPHDAEVTDNAVDVLVAAVRGKLDAPYDRRVLSTVRGRGYRIG